VSDLYTIEIAGENALIIYFSDNIHDESFNLVQQATHLIKTHLSNSIIDFVPSYGSILIQYDLLAMDHFRLKALIRNTLKTLHRHSKPVGKLIDIPVYYSPSTGPDLKRIANRSNLSIKDVIDLHQANIYKVYAIGFAPGFAYLGQVNQKIATPRLDTPRLNVPKGAVAIADQQTAIYPNNTPGGWNIIGSCPINLFNANTKPHMPFQVGDQVKFIAISKSDFLTLGGLLPQSN